MSLILLRLVTNEPADGPCGGARWAICDAEVGRSECQYEGRWRNMKTKISVISCFLVSLLMVFPMSAVADGDGTMRLNAWVSPGSYQIPDEDPQIYSVWDVTDPEDFEHAYCYVKVTIHKKMTTLNWEYEGDFVVGSGGGGDVDVYCNQDDGDAQLSWDISAASPPVSAGDYYAVVYAEAWDAWPFPDNVVYDTAQSNDFELTY